MPIYDWASEDEDIFTSLPLEHSQIKILLKTKDDPWFIRDWFEHHAAIAGPENIIIFDNASTDPDVVAFYREIADRTTIIRNALPVNHIHNIHKCPSLYAAIKRSCAHFCVLDTDERLMLMDSPNSIAAPSTIALQLAAYAPGQFIPTLWLGNAFRSATQFKMANQTEMVNSLKWGKPIISTADIPDTFINHNCQIGPMAEAALDTGFLLLHLKNLSPEQRISANLRKLENYGYVSPGTAAEDAILCDTTKIKRGDAQYWVTEIRSLLGSLDTPEQRAQVVIDGLSVSYATDEARALMEAFIDDASQFYSQAEIIRPAEAAQ